MTFSPVRLRVPATTSNLGPGFDCFGMALDLHLEVEARPAPRLAVTAEGADVPLDRTNLVVATMLAALSSQGVTGEPGVAIHLRNHIPLARGLGSSASARVAGLALAQLVRGVAPAALDRAAIAREASRLEHHPDNATAATLGGFCISAGEETERVEMNDRIYLALISELEIHTEAARAALPKSVPLEDAVVNLQRAALFAARLTRQRDLSAGIPFEDRLHQRHRLALNNRLSRLFAALRGAASVEALFLSGSGPTILLLPRDVEVCRRDAEALCDGVGLGAQLRTLQADNAGLAVELI